MDSHRILDPLNLADGLAALIMRSLRSFSVAAYQKPSELAQRCNELADAFEDWIALEGGSPELGIEAHRASQEEGESYPGEGRALSEEALTRMKGLFDWELFHSLWI